MGADHPNTLFTLNSIKNYADDEEVLVNGKSANIQKSGESRSSGDEGVDNEDASSNGNGQASDELHELDSGPMMVGDDVIYGEEDEAGWEDESY